MGALIGLHKRGAGRDAAGVGVLDDRDCRLSGVEFRDEFECCIGIVDVVVGEFLALHDPGGGNALAPWRAGIEPRRLMGVLAIA